MGYVYRATGVSVRVPLAPVPIKGQSPITQGGILRGDVVWSRPIYLDVCMVRVVVYQELVVRLYIY